MTQVLISESAGIRFSSEPYSGSLNDGSYSLQHLLDIALGPVTRSNKYKLTRKRTLTRRATVWLGQTCNLRCNFCHFIDRIIDPKHPEHRFMSLEKVKAICNTLVEEYKNNAVDLQGGEPTLFQGIYDLVSYCREIGLHPTLITNAQKLADRDVVIKYKQAGIRDFLISIQGLGEVYDQVVGRNGAHVRQMLALRNLQEVGIPFRFNVVMSKLVVPQLPDIARLAIATHANAVNYLVFNPFGDLYGKRNVSNVPHYSEIREPLRTALDLLISNDIEANVRYLPFCMLDSKHFPSNYNFQQLSYDHHENDFNSWRWTGRENQRTFDKPLGKCPNLGELPRHDILRRLIHKSRSVKSRLKGDTRDQDGLVHNLYREDGKWRAACDNKYAKTGTCNSCDLRNICDGFHGDYVKFFGTGEARAIRLGKMIDDPLEFIKEQLKIVQKEDESWAL